MTTSQDATVSVFAKDLAAALKQITTAMRKVPASDRRKNPMLDVIAITSTPDSLTIRTMDPDGPGVTIFANVQSDFSAMITLHDGTALAATLNKREAVLIAQTMKQTIFMQASEVRGRYDSWSFNPPPDLVYPWAYTSNERCAGIAA